MSPARQAPEMKEVLAHLALDKFFGTLGPRGTVLLCQAPLAAALLLVVVAVALFSRPTFADGFFLAFLGLFVLVTVLCFAAPWHRLPARSFLVVPVLDFVLIALAREASGETVISVGLLLVFPVIWLAVSLGKAGVLASFLATVLVVLVPLAANSAVAAGDFARPFLLPTIMLVVALSVYAMTASMKDQQARLEAKDAQLREALELSGRRAQLLDTVLDTVPAGVQAVDADGHRTIVNRQQRRYQDLALADEHSSPEMSEAPQVYADDRVTPLQPRRYPLNRALAKETFTDYLIWIGPPERQRAVSTAAHAMTDPNGDFIGSVLAFTDVTELIEALTVRDDFIANVSHEFRTPLTAMMGFIDLTLEDTERLPADAVRKLRIAQRNGERLVSLVSDLLSTASVSTALDEQDIDLADVITMSVASAAPRATEHGLELEEELPEPLWVYADPSRMGQVLDNLISNAIKYTPRGGAVTVRGTRSGDRAVIEVTDTGIGMDKADAARVFSKYFRSRKVRGSQIPGIGLGLGIVKTLVENHGGTISVNTMPGEGSTFTFTIPLSSHSPTGHRHNLNAQTDPLDPGSRT